MENHHWLSRWKNGNIAFHLSTVNPLLEKHWSTLKIPANSNILVPLCGKSLDLLWLANQGHQVIGVELSKLACEAFFKENKIPYDIEKTDNFTCFYNAQIKLYCGDFFELTSALLPPFAAVYDRAALIALPEELRQRYVHHVMHLMDPGCQMLLIVYESENNVQGPPYPIPFNEIKKLYEKRFHIHVLAHLQKIKLPEHLYVKGYRQVNEVVYHLKQ
jgi:thiopurine S-methyltransferase